MLSIVRNNTKFNFQNSHLKIKFVSYMLSYKNDFKSNQTTITNQTNSNFLLFYLTLNAIETSVISRSRQSILMISD